MALPQGNTQLEEITLIEKLKGLIISEARAIFCTDYPSSDGNPHMFDVVIGHVARNDRERGAEYEALVIVYGRDQSAWTRLMKNHLRDNRSPVAALQNLREALYRRAGMSRKCMKVDEEYLGETEETKKKYTY